MERASDFSPPRSRGWEKQLSHYDICTHPHSLVTPSNPHALLGGIAYMSDLKTLLIGLHEDQYVIAFAR
jgi:hypothetical protein